MIKVDCCRSKGNPTNNGRKTLFEEARQGTMRMRGHKQRKTCKNCGGDLSEGQKEFCCNFCVSVYEPKEFKKALPGTGKQYVSRSRV